MFMCGGINVYGAQYMCGGQRLTLVILKNSYLPTLIPDKTPSQ